MEGQRVPEEDVGQEDGERVAEGGGDEQDRMRRGDAHARAREGRSARHKNAPRRHAAPYSFGFRLRVVKLRLEEGLEVEEICRATGVGADSVFKWVSLYRDGGEEALRPKLQGKRGRAQLPPEVKAEMVALKQENPSFGVKRISQFLRRMLHLPGSPETVRRTLHEEGLIEPVRPKREKSAPKPRFFERSTPNQLWQTDIFTFRLAGKNAYLIGFIDDYSRYIVGLEVYRSQTAENVMEVYRRAVGEYGVPREMLTDNGRQFASWRGTSRFEQELKKDKVHHIRSQPHHPMTLGKIERFWESIWGDFLCRAQFDSFESARERLRFWIQYYNHRRPHQGIGGLCPADRFFEIRNDLRKVIEKGVQENVLELALRGAPQRPFYMVGRLDNQSVVMQAVKGKLVMTVDDHRKHSTEQMICDLNEGKVTHEQHTQEDPAADASLLGCGQVPSRTESVDGTPVAVATVSGTGSDVEPAHPVAGAGDGGDVACPGAETGGTLRSGAVEHPTAEPVGTEERAADPVRTAGGETGTAPDTGEASVCTAAHGGDHGSGLDRPDEPENAENGLKSALPPPGVSAAQMESLLRLLAGNPALQYVMEEAVRRQPAAEPYQQEDAHGRTDHEAGQRTGRPAPGTDHGRDEGRALGDPGGRCPGRVAPDVLRVVQPGPGGTAGLVDRSRCGTPGQPAAGPGEGALAAGEGRSPAQGQTPGGCDPDP